MNGDMLLEIMYQMHIQQTCSSNPPFWQKINIKNVTIPDNEEQLKKIQGEAFQNFLKLPEAKLRG